MLSGNRFALKEWASVCDRVGRGEIILLVRKGGILEVRRGFRVEHREFFLFPTRFHEKGQAPPDRVALELYAVVEEDFEVRDRERLARLEGQHGVPAGDLERRFRYGREAGVHVLALRAWRLARPQVLEGAGAFEGCVSWVDLGRELEVGPASPALDDGGFRRKLEALRAALHG
jgi:hypothetical protein